MFERKKIYNRLVLLILEPLISVYKNMSMRTVSRYVFSL